MTRRTSLALAMLLAGTNLIWGQAPTKTPVADSQPTREQLAVPPASKTPLVEDLPGASVTSLANPATGADCCVCGPYQCAPAPRCYVISEYLLWWTQRQNVPVPLLSTGPLDAPGASVLLGNNAPFASQPHQGGRFTIGTWGRDQNFGIEGNYFFLGQRTDNAQVNSPIGAGAIPTAYPFIAPNGQEAAFFLAFPPGFTSATTLSLFTRMQGAEINTLYNLSSSGTSRVALIAGARYLDLRENLSLRTYSPAIPPTTQNDFLINDEFSTRNQFYGGQLGARFEAIYGRFFVNGTGKVALGSVNQETNVNGSFRRITPTTDQTTVGGIFTQSSNIGNHARSELAWMPEVTLNAGVNLTDRVRVFTGYNFLWINNVVRPGDQIDRVLNPSQFFGNPLVGAARPTVSSNNSSFWTQGINLGLEIRF